MKWFQDIFTKTRLMVVSGILALLCWAALLINSIFIKPFFIYSFYFILAAILLGLMIAYQKGETSVQKALSASFLSSALVMYWFEISGYFGSWYSNSLAILETAMTVITAILFLNHIILQMDHKGDLKLITVNEILLLVAVAIQLAELVAHFFHVSFYYDWLNSLGFLFSYAFITCMEARIQKYKARRYIAMKEGRWTEEERLKSKKIFKF